MAGVVPKLAASSLVEVVVAMVLISIVTTVSMLIYLNSMQHMASGRKHQLEVTAQYHLQTYEALSEDQKEGFVDEEGNEVAFEVIETPWEGLEELIVTLSDSMDVYRVEKRRLIYLRE